jgi:hypothetical protein
VEKFTSINMDPKVPAGQPMERFLARNSDLLEGEVEEKVKALTQ